MAGRASPVSNNLLVQGRASPTVQEKPLDLMTPSQLRGEKAKTEAVVQSKLKMMRNLDNQNLFPHELRGGMNQMISNAEERVKEINFLLDAPVPGFIQEDE